MGAVIFVVNPQDKNLFWRKEVGEAEFRKVQAFQSKRVVGLEAFLYPIHTKVDFLRNFLTPSLVYISAEKTDHIAIKILVVFGGLILDILTFPIRLITVIPRLFLNDDTKQDHPLYKYLQENRANLEVFSKTDYVFVKLCWTPSEGEVFPPRPESMNGTTDVGTNNPSTTGQGRRHEQFILNFVEVPAYRPMGYLSGLLDMTNEITPILA